MGKELLDVGFERPLERVKESLKVSLLDPCSTPSLNMRNKLDRNNFSVASSCFDRADELVSEGFDESTIRSVIGTMYLGEKTYCPLIRSIAYNTLCTIGAVDTVGICLVPCS